MEQMCYNCGRPTLVVYWAGITVCVNCGREYDDYEKAVPNVQARETSERISDESEQRENVSPK